MWPEAHVIHSAVRSFSRLFWIVSSFLCLPPLNASVRSLSEQYHATGPAVRTRESLSQPEGAEFVVCWIASKWILHHRTDIRIRLRSTFNVTVRRFCPARDWYYWQWHRWCYWHNMHTVDWQHTLSTYCTCSPQVYWRSEWIKTNTAAPHQWRPHLAFWLQDKENRLHPGAN